MKVAESILHAAPIGCTKSIWKTSTQGELELSFIVTSAPLLMSLYFLDKQKQKKDTCNRLYLNIQFIDWC